MNLRNLIKGAPLWLREGPSLIIAGGTLLRVLGINESLWFDEAYTARLANLDWGHFLKSILADSAPPGWPTIEFLVTRILGRSEIALRLPALILGAAIMLLVYLLALEISKNKAEALIACALCAILPVGLYFSVEARQYNMLAAGVLLCGWGAIKDRPVAIVGGALAALYAQNVGLIYVLLLGGPWAVWSVARGRIRRVLFVGGALCAAFGPWLPALIGQARAVGQSFWLPPMTFPQLLTPLAMMIMGWRVPEGAQIPIYFTGLICTILGIYASRFWLFSRGGLIILLIGVGAPLTIGVLSFVWRNIYLPRALLPSALMIPLFWAAAIRNAPPFAQMATRAVIVGSLTACLFWFATPPLNGRIDMKAWFAPLNEEWKDGDILYFGNEAVDVLADYYAPHRGLSRPRFGDFMSMPNELKINMGIDAAPLEFLSNCRIWAVLSIMPTSTAGEIDEAERIRVYARLIRFRQDKGPFWQGIFLIERKPCNERNNRSLFTQPSPS